MNFYLNADGLALLSVLFRRVLRMLAQREAKKNGEPKAKRVCSNARKTRLK